MSEGSVDHDVTPVEALVELARSSREDRLPSVLATVAETVRRIAGYRSVVVNLFRPAWDDYHVVFAVDTPEGVAALVGTTQPSAIFRRLETHAEERLPGVYLVHDRAFWDGMDDVYFSPDWRPSDDPEAWQFYDGLFVVLKDAGGAIVGNLSIDEPRNGRRPTDDEVRLLRAIGSHAEHALDGAQRNERAAETARHQRLLLNATSALSACERTSELMQTMCDSFVPGLGFERIAVYRRVSDHVLALGATAGWESSALLAQTLSSTDVTALLTAADEHLGCWLLDAAQLFSSVAPGNGERSRRNGNGRLAWHDSCLAIPARAADGTLIGLIAIEDPVDHLLPSESQRYAARWLVDHATTVQSAIETRKRLQHLATHDPLTGVRNRRHLTEMLSEHRDSALLICDLDKFKAINDVHGHDLGDRVLVRFGELLRELARDSDVPMRLGGEEFCVLLPKTDRAGAMAAAERLRVETSARMHDLIPGGVTVSVGVAVSSKGVLDAGELLSAADRALYAAKAAGRNRVQAAASPV